MTFPPPKPILKVVFVDFMAFFIGNVLEKKFVHLNLIQLIIPKMLPFFSQSFSNIQKITIAVAEIHQLKQIPENIEVFKEEIYQKFTINPITLGEVQKQHHVVENGNGRATVVYRINFTGDKDLFFYSRKEI